jgi:hypothetical protein
MYLHVHIYTVTLHSMWFFYQHTITWIWRQVGKKVHFRHFYGKHSKKLLWPVLETNFRGGRSLIGSISWESFLKVLPEFRWPLKYWCKSLLFCVFDGVFCFAVFCFAVLFVYFIYNIYAMGRSDLSANAAVQKRRRSYG